MPNYVTDQPWDTSKYYGPTRMNVMNANDLALDKQVKANADAIASILKYRDVTETTTSSGAFPIPDDLKERVINFCIMSTLGLAIRRDWHYISLYNYQSLAAVSNFEVTVRFFYI